MHSVSFILLTRSRWLALVGLALASRFAQEALEAIGFAQTHLHLSEEDLRGDKETHLDVSEKDLWGDEELGFRPRPCEGNSLPPIAVGGNFLSEVLVGVSAVGVQGVCERGDQGVRAGESEAGVQGDRCVVEVSNPNL